ncbi:MAG: addiction module antitoxin [Kangiella sp.]|nr:MAG: addiction module antitoxin [Kangiella sp.]
MEICFSPEFKHNLRQLAKRYRSIRVDVEAFTTQLLDGEMPGAQISGTGYTLYKVRLKNSDNNRGKSAGYRVVYYLQTAEEIALVTIYSKSDQSDVSVDELKNFMRDYEATKK